MYGTPRFAEMRDKCIGQELSWERPAVKWEAVLEELFYGESAAAPQPPRPSPAEAKASVTTPVQVPTSDRCLSLGRAYTVCMSRLKVHASPGGCCLAASQPRNMGDKRRVQIRILHFRCLV